MASGGRYHRYVSVIEELNDKPRRFPDLLILNLYPQVNCLLKQMFCFAAPDIRDYA